jgi:hypothetical protein
LSTPHPWPDEASLEDRLDAEYLFDDDELSESSDPFEILAAKEAYLGQPLYFTIIDQEIH